jgi:predicted ABC-type ATPase
MIPEFEDFKKNYPEHAAQLVHRESTDIGALSINALIKKKRNFIIDGTLRRPDRVEKLVDKLKKAGYQIHVYIADVPIEVAKERADKRGQETGRFVPHEIIEATHREVPQTVEAIKHKVDSYNVFDTSDGARLFASNRFVEPERYKQFLDKGKVKYNVRADR